MTNGAASKPRLSRAETKDNTHRALLDAAETCFLNFGYQGATLDAIAAEAGFTKGAVYSHFSSKEALFVELLAEGMRRNSQDAERILTLLSEKPELLDDELGSWIDEFDAHNNVPLLALEMDMESRRSPSFAALLGAVVAKQQNEVSRYLARYFEAVGRDSPLPVEELASVMIALSKAVALARQTRHSHELNSAKVMRLLLGMPVARSARKTQR
ncbi:MAG: TetR/AcrR family transcriptional regulator [Sphingomicrobium sp.]